MSRQAPPRISGSCFYCNQKRQHCSATDENKTYPCERCVDKAQDLTKCRPHREDDRWVPGVSGATHVRGGVSKKSSPKKNSPKKKNASPENANSPSNRPLRRSSRKSPSEDNAPEAGPSTQASQWPNTTEQEDASKRKQNTVAADLQKREQEETERTGVSPLELSRQRAEAEYQAVLRMTLGELRAAWAEERPLMGRNGTRRMLEPPPGADDLVYGDLVGNGRPSGSSVSVKPQRPDQDDY